MADDTGRKSAAERKAELDAEKEIDAIEREQARRLEIRNREELLREVVQRVALETFDPGTAPGEKEFQGLQRDSTKPLTPQEVEQGLAWTYRMEERIADTMLQLVSAETAAEIAYKARHLVVTSDPNCPLVQRGTTTVAERDDWVLAQEFEEYVEWQLAKKRVKNCRAYLEFLDRQTSRLQTLARSVGNAYNGAGR